MTNMDPYDMLESLDQDLESELTEERMEQLLDEREYVWGLIKPESSTHYYDS